MKAEVVNGENSARIIGGYGDICRNGGVRYRGAGGRRLDKPKLNLDFTTEILPKRSRAFCSISVSTPTWNVSKRHSNGKPQMLLKRRTSGRTKDENRGVLQSFDG